MATKLIVAALLAAVACAQGFNFDNVYPIEHFVPGLEMELTPEMKKSREYDFAPSIIGGSNATRGQVPHHAVLFLNFPEGRALCGASIIANKYLLTAAHCVHPIKDNPENATAYVNILHIAEVADSPALKVKKIHVHAQYTGKQEDHFHNDIAILELTTSITFTDNVKKIEINRAARPAHRSKCQNAGFGKFHALKNFISETMKITTISVAQTTTCGRLRINMHEGQLCMHSWITNPCQGDSGGALTKTEGNQTYQVGIVSFGFLGCIIAPHVQTNVYHYVDWIDQIARD
jgi:secreted trypsin-like serine protease